MKSFQPPQLWRTTGLAPRSPWETIQDWIDPISVNHRSPNSSIVVAFFAVLLLLIVNLYCL